MEKKDQMKLYLSLDKEIYQLLVENNVTIEDLLKRDGINVSTIIEKNPVVEKYSQDRDVFTVLIGASILILSLTPAIVKALEYLGKKPVFVMEEVLVPIEDSQGNVVIGEDGKPMLYWTEKAKIIQQNSLGESKQKMNLEAIGAKVSYEGESKDKTK